MSVNKLLKSRSLSNQGPVSVLVDKVAELTSSRQFNSEELGKGAIAVESLNDAEAQALASTYNGMESTLQSMVRDSKISLEAHNVEAGALAGMFATNPKAAMAAKLSANPSASILPVTVPNASMERFAMEAFDERENRNSQMYSIVYNMLASRQDEFGETFYPTIVVNPTEVGVTVSLKLFQVYNDFKRSISGSLANYGRKNLIRAYADAGILQNDLTRAVPVLRLAGADANADKFVDTTLVPSWTENVASSVSVPTGALKVDTRVDLLGLSQTNELLNNGLMGPSDSLDTYLKVDKLFVQVTDGTVTEVLQLSVGEIPSAVFTYAPQGNYRKMLLALDTTGVVLDDSTVSVTGAALASLPELATNSARVSLNVNGSVTLDKGDTIVNRGTLNLVALRNATGQLVTGAAFDSLAAKLETATVIGYTLVAYRANTNIRQRGQLLDTQIEYRVVPVPYRSPFAKIMPVSMQDGDDRIVLESLITTTGVSISNEAVTSLLRARTSLSAYRAVQDGNGELPEIGTLGGIYVNPTYFEENLDLANVVDSMKSHERLKDIRAAIVEKVRYYANEMYRRSEYKAAASVLTGNVGFKPTVIIGTDPVIYNYLQADGDMRLLGDTFDVKVVSTMDSRVRGKIFISFGIFDGSEHTGINPLTFGNMLWSPEILTTVNSAPDNGAIVKQLLVTPRYNHNWNLPVLTTLHIDGLPSVTGKVTINTHEV